MAIELERSILLVSGALMVALAGAILAAAPRRNLNRALAGLVAARGAATLLPQLSREPQWTWTAVNLQPYFVLAVFVLAVYCMHLVAAASPRKGMGWLALSAILVLEGTYMLWHSSVHTLAAGTTPIGALVAGPGYAFTGFGPLSIVTALVIPAMATLALLFALRYRRTAETPDGTMDLLLAGGFLLGSLFDATSRLASLSALLDDSTGYPWAPWGWAPAVLPVAALVPGLLAAAVLAAGRNVEPRPQRILEGRLLVLAAFAFFSGFLRLVGPSSSDPGGQALVLVLLGAWRLSMPVLVAYALVERTWRGITDRTREAVAWVAFAATLALVAGACAMAVSLVVTGPSPAPVVAAFIGLCGATFASRSILRLCRRFADWLVPMGAGAVPGGLQPVR